MKPFFHVLYILLVIVFSCISFTAGAVVGNIGAYNNIYLKDSYFFQRIIEEEGVKYDIEYTSGSLGEVVVFGEKLTDLQKNELRNIIKDRFGTRAAEIMIR